jgi:hypothetical protein
MVELKPVLIGKRCKQAFKTPGEWLISQMKVG